MFVYLSKWVKIVFMLSDFVKSKKKEEAVVVILLTSWLFGRLEMKYIFE